MLRAFLHEETGKVFKQPQTGSDTEKQPPETPQGLLDMLTILCSQTSDFLQHETDAELNHWI